MAGKKGFLKLDPSIHNLGMRRRDVRERTVVAKTTAQTNALVSYVLLETGIVWRCSEAVPNLRKLRSHFFCDARVDCPEARGK